MDLRKAEKVRRGKIQRGITETRDGCREKKEVWEMIRIVLYLKPQKSSSFSYANTQPHISIPDYSH